MAELNSNLYYRYWGKAERDGTGCHLLPYHSLDVAAVGQVLLRQHIRLRQHLAALAGMNEPDFVRWMVFFLALHDLGKFADAFQNLRPELLLDLQHRESTRGYAERHDTLGYLLWRHQLRPLFSTLGIVNIEKRSRRRAPGEIAADFWMRAVTGHHGLPPKAHDALLRDYFQEPQDTDAVAAFATDLADLILGVDRRFPSLIGEKLAFASWWLSGFTVLCDWLGSGLESSAYRADPIPLPDYWHEALSWADKAVAKAGLLPAVPAQSLTLEDFFTGKTTTRILPTPLQAKATEQPLGDGPQLFILEDVTGAGKTEAAVLLVHRLMALGLINGVYFGLPTMATANAMYDRMGEIYRRLFSLDTDPSLVLAHSARELSFAFRQSIPPAPHTENDDYGDGATPATTHCNAWLADNRKKALLAEIGVGTIDQALLAILPARHQSLRLLGLLDKVLLVDEVHACDAYMHTLLRALLRAHAASGGSAILLSATLPQVQRQALVDAFAEGLGCQGPMLEKTETKDYPLLTHYRADDLEEHCIATRESVRRCVGVEFLHTEDTALAVIADAVAKGQCVCWIRNTVADARRAWGRLQEDLPEVSIDLFHARYAMADRLDIEERVLARFGPESTPDDRRGRALIATQVVEQSLDLDFDVLITDLAPIDLIVQRAGRLRRHNRDTEGRRINGPDARGKPQLHILSPLWSDDPDSGWLRNSLPGTAAVYRHQDGMLWLGLGLLRENGGFRMPEDARTLIEGVYSEAALDEIPEGLQEVTFDQEADRLARNSQANLNALKLELGYQKEESNIWWDEAVTPTRLGDESITVYLARWQGGTLHPWAKDGDHRWARSAVAVRKTLIAQEGCYREIPDEVLAAARESLPAKGKWGVLLPLIEQESTLWRGNARNGHDAPVEAYYSNRDGLMVENKPQGQ